MPPVTNDFGKSETQGKKWSKKKRRKRQKKLISSKKKGKKQSLEYNESSFYNFIKNTDFNQKTKVKKRYGEIAVVKIPANFSLIEKPDDAIEVFQSIYNFHKQGIKGIHFDHSLCKKIDIGAETVMDVFALNLESYYKKKGISLILDGKYPNDSKVNSLIVTSGIVRNLGAAEELRREYLDSGLVKATDLLSGGKHTPTFKIKSLKSADDRSVSDFIATQLVNYFDECVRTQGYHLEQEGEEYLSQIVSETINNCELHSGKFCQWFAQSFYLIENRDEYGELHLVLFNFGQTIYQGLKYDIKDKDMYQQLKDLSDEHTRKKLFRPGEWDEEVLWTLYSLQDGVSRMRSDDGLDRGNGTIDLIRAFQTIGDTTKDGKTPTMSIISGSAYIYFDKSYTLEPMETAGNERYQIAFNESNDLRQPPDKSYVKKLKNFFPGTAITLRFYLDKDYIEKVKNNGKND